MFERFCKRPAALARHRAGPLLQERLTYLVHLAGQGMCVRSLQQTAEYLLVVADYLRLVDRPSEVIGKDEIDLQAVRWAKRRLSPSMNRSGGRTSHKVFCCQATNWLKFLGRFQQQLPPASWFDGMIAEFADYMDNERGLSATTIHDRCRFVRRWFDQLGAVNGSLRDITIAQIDAVLLKMIAGGYAPMAIETYANHLRAFFRFAGMRGWCGCGLADAIRGPRIFTHASLPSGPNWDDVSRLLASTEGDRPMDIRDRAILMLLAVYGLRAGEVTHLRLDDIDWGQELIFVTCSKTRSRRTCPLTRPVGNAILRYLKEVRPRSAHRDIFLSTRAPIQPVRELWALVARRLRRLGLSLPHYGPHALRHACASYLLAQGLSLKEIGDHLGHRDPGSTRIYAKVDLPGLRAVADFELGGVL
jgi:integrase/recombinase XerD